MFFFFKRYFCLLFTKWKNKELSWFFNEMKILLSSLFVKYKYRNDSRNSISVIHWTSDFLWKFCCRQVTVLDLTRQIKRNFWNKKIMYWVNFWNRYYDLSPQVMIYSCLFIALHISYRIYPLLWRCIGNLVTRLGAIGAILN